VPDYGFKKIPAGPVVRELNAIMAPAIIPFLPTVVWR